MGSKRKEQEGRGKNRKGEKREVGGRKRRKVKKGR